MEYRSVVIRVSGVPPQAEHLFEPEHLNHRHYYIECLEVSQLKNTTVQVFTTRLLQPIGGTQH